VAQNFRFEALEKFHEGIDFGVHGSAYRDAPAVDFCRIFSGFFLRKIFSRVKRDILQKLKAPASP